jgi:hypothetical protein
VCRSTEATGRRRTRKREGAKTRIPTRYGGAATDVTPYPVRFRAQPVTFPTAAAMLSPARCGMMRLGTGRPGWAATTRRRSSSRGTGATRASSLAVRSRGRGCSTCSSGTTIPRLGGSSARTRWATWTTRACSLTPGTTRSTRLTRRSWRPKACRPCPTWRTPRTSNWEGGARPLRRGPSCAKPANSRGLGRTSSRSGVPSTR